MALVRKLAVQEKPVSVFIKAPDCRFKTHLKNCEPVL